MSPDWDWVSQFCLKFSEHSFLSLAPFSASYPAPARVVPFAVDLSKPETVPGVLAAIAAALGPIEVLIYNASKIHALLAL